MTSSDYNPNDIEFLISRDIDGDLSPDGQRRLRERLAESPELRDEAERLRSVVRAISQWGEDQPSIDWASHAKLIQAKLTEPADGSDQRLDEMLRGWAAERPAIDEDALTADVLSRIRVRRRSGRLYSLLRIGAPLAAAAVLALSVSTIFWAGPQTAPPSTFVSIRTNSVSLAESRVEVSFDRSAHDVVEATVETSSIAFLTLGAAPASSGESAPL